MGSIAGSQTAPTSGSTQWAYDVLRGLGNSSPNGAQVGFLTFLAGVEGVPTDNNNPLDISESGSLNEWGQIGASDASVLANEQGTNNGATTPGVWNAFGSDEHVTTYASYAGGVQATIDFLNANHEKIVAVLTAKNPTKLEVAQGFLQDGAWGSPTSGYIGDAPKIAAWVNSTSASGSSEPGLAQYALNNGGYDPGVSPAELTPSATKWLASMGNPHNCDSTKFLITIPGIPHVTSKTGIISNCQMKAFLGGLMVGFGASIMIFGIITIGGGLVSQTSAGRAVLGTVNPVKRVLGAAKAQGSATASAPEPSPPPAQVTPAPDAGRAAARRDWEAKHGRPWSESAAGRAEAQRRRS